MKKLISIILTITIAIGISTNVFAAIPQYGEEYQNQPTTEYAQTFKDVSTNYWAFEYISEMVARDILSGYPNGYFYPNNTITRAEFSKIMCLAAGLPITAVDSTSYVDVSADKWYAPFVECGKYYLSGYISDGKKYYMPEDNALREDIAVALVKLKGYDTSIYDESILKAMFTDWQSISQGARKYVSVAVEQGLISGYEDNTFRGQNTITRAEAATLLWRAYQYGNGNKFFEKEEFEEPEVVKPVETPEPEYSETENEPDSEIIDEKEKLKLTLSVDKSNINITSGEIAEFSVTIGFNFLAELGGNIERTGYIPSFEGNEDILESLWGSERTTENNETVTIYRTNELQAGKYVLKLYVTDDYTTTTKTVTINVTEPEPEYTFELTTVATNISNVEKIVSTNKGIIYSDNKDNIYEITDDDVINRCIFSASNLDYLGTEDLTKSEQANLWSSLVGIGFNNNNNHVYALIEQRRCYYLYDVNSSTVDNVIEFKQTNSENYVNHGSSYINAAGYELTFDDENNTYINGVLVLDGKVDAISVMDKIGYMSRSLIFSVGDIICYWGSGIHYRNNRTGNWELLDYYIPVDEEFVCANSEYMFFTSKEKIYTVDMNGDADVLCTIDDIDNSDNKVIKFENIMYHLSTSDDNNRLFYWDKDYNCIRQLSEK